MWKVIWDFLLPTRNTVWRCPVDHQHIHSGKILLAGVLHSQTFISRMFEFCSATILQRHWGMMAIHKDFFYYYWVDRTLLQGFDSPKRGFVSKYFSRKEYKEIRVYHSVIRRNYFFLISDFDFLISSCTKLFSFKRRDEQSRFIMVNSQSSIFLYVYRAYFKNLASELSNKL